MQPLDVLGATLLVLVTVGIGITIHELSHAAVLRSLHIPYEIQWFPGQRGQSTRTLFTPLATVTPGQIPDDISTLGVRLSALAPLALTLPVALIAVGFVSDPLSSGNLFGSVVTIAWLACAIPSPQDFSVFWHAERLVERETDGSLHP